LYIETPGRRKKFLEGLEVLVAARRPDEAAASRYREVWAEDTGGIPFDCEAKFLILHAFFILDQRV